MKKFPYDNVMRVRAEFRPDVYVSTVAGNEPVSHADKKSLPHRRVNPSRRRVCRFGTQHGAGCLERCERKMVLKLTARNRLLFLQMLCCLFGDGRKDVV